MAKTASAAPLLLTVSKEKTVSFHGLLYQAESMLPGVSRSKIAVSLDPGGQGLLVSPLPAKRKDAHGPYDDSRFEELLGLVSTKEYLAQEVSNLLETWSPIIGTRFSHGSIVHLLRVGSPSFVRAFTARCLFLHADKADRACRALTMWPYWTKSERCKLIGVVVASSEAVAGTHAAYILTRLHELWDRTTYKVGIPQSIPSERDALIRFLEKRCDGESARLALTWSKIQHSFRWDRHGEPSLLPSETARLQKLFAHT